MSIILKKGPEANRAGLSLETGEVIFATDTRRLYVGSGSESGGVELSFNQLSASYVSASVVTATVISASSLSVTTVDAVVTSMSVDYLQVNGTMMGTSSWSETASYLLGFVESASFSQNAATASFLSGFIESAIFAETASYFNGVIDSASFSTTSSNALYSETASYLSSSGQIVAEGDLLVTDTSSDGWVGNSAYIGSGIFVQRNGSIARSTLFSAGSTLDGNGADTIAVAGGSFGSIGATQQGHFGAWQLQTFGGSTWSTTARMLMQAGGDHDEDSRPTNIVFQTTPSGSSTLQTRLKVNGTGVQVTGSLGVEGSIGINASMVMSKKFVTLNTLTYSTALTLNMEDDTATYVKVSLHGAWQGSGSAVYVGEFFLQKDDSNTYQQPGAIISQVNNSACGEILANLFTPTPGTGAQDLMLQFWASSSADPVGDFLMLYEVRGQYNTVT